MQSSTLAGLLATQFLGTSQAVPAACSVVIMAIFGLILASYWGSGSRIRDVAGGFLPQATASLSPWQAAARQMVIFPWIPLRVERPIPEIHLPNETGATMKSSFSTILHEVCHGYKRELQIVGFLIIRIQGSRRTTLWQEPLVQDAEFAVILTHHTVYCRFG